MKLDLGSGPRDFWVSEDPEWLHLDCEDYDGVVKWRCPDRIPVDDGTVDEVYMGQFLKELSISDHLALAREIDRVCMPGAVLKVHCYGDEKSGIKVWKAFFDSLEHKGWLLIKEEPVNRWEEENLYTYLVVLVKRSM